MKKAVFGLARSENDAEMTVKRLRAAGFENDAISVLFVRHGNLQETNTQRKSGWLKDRGTMAHEKHTKAPEGATTGALSGGVIGGALGALAGIGALTIPGFGPLIAAGPLMAALAGSAVGGSVGLVVGGLVGMGIPEYEAKQYENSLKAGGVLISVHTNDSEDIDRANTILKEAGATDISTSSEKARSGS